MSTDTSRLLERIESLRALVQPMAEDLDRDDPASWQAQGAVRVLDILRREIPGMTEQLPVRARSTDPRTSHDAAQWSVSSSMTNVLRRGIVRFFYPDHEYDDQQLIEQCISAGIQVSGKTAELARGGSNVTKRRSDLEKQGFVEPTGAKNTYGPGSSLGLYRLTEAGRAWHQYNERTNPWH